MRLIMLIALFGMIVMMFDVPGGKYSIRFGAFVLGAILVIVIVNLASALPDDATHKKT
ncbi:hypothetical protein JM93_03131 [Roseibium hamelinense]|uniref:Uncharacterized protein n=1 Tax=Roseibium hamelinense TaxID=150831 RepID=A0A562SU14_9HYPH|nr:hypothetical protein [Roseibium hamelinense]TWI84795.1 hypothetical protein JM93_03131 [Roseibium hamelinense]